MKICILQSAYPPTHNLSTLDPGADPSPFTPDHTFTHHWIHKSTAHQQIRAIVAEDFDFYFNFMWGQYEDEVAGIEACAFFESFSLPAIGLWSDVLKRTKNDFYRDARILGAPRVPGMGKYPLFVKPASGCSSLGISERSICHTREELVDALRDINKALDPGRKDSIRVPSPTSIVDGIPIPDDIVVQEFIQGWDHSVVVIEIGNTPVPLAPERYVYPADFKPEQRFLTFETKFHHDTTVEVIKRENDPVVFDKLQKAAVEAFYACKLTGKGWCNVDIRVTETGDPVVIEVNPMPAVFLPEGHEWEDKCIRESFPGGHRALIDTMIATHFMQRKDKNGLAGEMGEMHEDLVRRLQLKPICDRIVSHGLAGSVLELASGCGRFGQALGDIIKDKTQDSPLINGMSISGIESCSESVEKCRQTGAYTKIHQGSIPSVLPLLGNVDHIVGLTLHRLSSLDFTLVMVRSFQLARKSLTVAILDLPENQSELQAHNHKSQMEATFAAPCGWELVRRDHQAFHTGVGFWIYFYERCS